MRKLFFILVLYLIFTKVVYSQDKFFQPDDLFHIDHMDSHNKKFAGIILETPFTSMIDAAKNFYPYIPVSLLLKDKFDNKNNIRNINVPVLIMHGEADQIVPFFMGKKIYEISKEPKYSYFTKHDNHMMEYDENLIKALNSFLKSLN